MGKDRLGAGLRWSGLLALLLTGLAASPTADVVVTGQVIYGSAEGAKRAAVADVVNIYDQSPAYMRMKVLGLSESTPRGKALFREAQQGVNRALARVAARHGLDVITVPDGVQGGDAPITDRTPEVIADLPVFCVEGQVLHGDPGGARMLAEIDSPALLAAIPAYQEWQALDATDARYHILRKNYQDAYQSAIRGVVRNQGLEAVVEKGGVTSRLGPVPDVTRAAIEFLGS